MIHGSVAHHAESGESDGGEMEEHGRRVGKSATSSSNVSIVLHGMKPQIQPTMLRDHILDMLGGLYNWV
jgi:hypothetical protein